MCAKADWGTAAPSKIVATVSGGGVAFLARGALTVGLNPCCHCRWTSSDSLSSPRVIRLIQSCGTLASPLRLPLDDVLLPLEGEGSLELGEGEELVVVTAGEGDRLGLS